MINHRDKAGNTEINWPQFTRQIKDWCMELGFSGVGITDTDLAQAEQRLSQWLDKNYHGEMGYMAKHGIRRTRPAELIPGTLRVISVRMDYLPEPMETSLEALAQQRQGFISRYALGRDYHKVIRNRLQKLAKYITDAAGALGYRAFCDSAPVMEKALAEKAGLGWIGKHTNLLNRDAGSWFFLGELYVDLPLIQDTRVSSHCGSCSACIDICPTAAIVAPYELDAKRCISYLTIELHGAIPIEFRKDMGNRIYGCDDCQLVCPWNRYATISVEADFKIRHPLHNRSLVELFKWDEATFLARTEGSAIRRIGHLRWLRNIAVALGNAPTSGEIISALEARRQHGSEIVREHVHWALEQHVQKH